MVNQRSHAPDAQLQHVRVCRFFSRLIRSRLFDVRQPPMTVHVQVVAHDLRDGTNASRNLAHPRNLRRASVIAAQVHHGSNGSGDELRSVAAHLHVFGDDVHGVSRTKQRLGGTRRIGGEILEQRVRRREYRFVRLAAIALTHGAE